MIKKYTLDIFITKATLIHGDKFDYSQINEEHIKNSNSYVPIKCNTCEYHWTPSINNHVYSKSGCPACSGNIRWTLDRFLTTAHQIHGDKYDCSKVTEQHIINQKSKVPITCNTCKYEWTPFIYNFINNKNGCLECSGYSNWTKDKFLISAYNIHQGKYDYSELTDSMVINSSSKISIKCNKCHYQWHSSIQSHINKKSDCPSCSGNAPWTLDRFLIRAHEIHGDKYDCSKVTEKHIINNKSKIPITCNICKYKWTPLIYNFIGSKRGCPDCNNNAPWTLDRFLISAIDIHEDKYDYSEINEEHINGERSNIYIKCKHCKYTWSTTISTHINRKSGCPHCSASKGYSDSAINWLRSIEKRENIIIQCITSKEGEFKIKAPYKGYYKADGYHEPTNTIYEYYGDYWHGNLKVFKEDDLNKTVGQTFGELYKKTIERENYIKSLGYNLVVKWETPLDENITD